MTSGLGFECCFLLQGVVSRLLWLSDAHRDGWEGQVQVHIHARNLDPCGSLDSEGGDSASHVSDIVEIDGGCDHLHIVS